MTSNRDPVLVTGAAGFIGFHVAERLLKLGRSVVGVDSLNAYYDPALKRTRLRELSQHSGFRFEQLDLTDRARTTILFDSHRSSQVVHLAAQPGVRHSLVDPGAYVDDNLVGFLNVLEGCRRNGCRHLIYASSSSVYGGNTNTPSSTADSADHPLNLYSATKRANELMAHAYAHLFGLSATGLRFFTVYGPWGRPDMAVWLFTEAILNGTPIRLFNSGRMRRDFTYIDDVTEAVVRLIDHSATPDPSWRGSAPDPATSFAPWRLYNIGNHTPVETTELVRLIEDALGRKAILELLPMQAGDVPETCADVAPLQAAIGFKPSTPLAEGVRRFVTWYRGHVA